MYREGPSIQDGKCRGFDIPRLQPNIGNRLLGRSTTKTATRSSGLGARGCTGAAVEALC